MDVTLTLSQLGEVTVRQTEQPAVVDFGRGMKVTLTPGMTADHCREAGILHRDEVRANLEICRFIGGHLVRDKRDISLGELLDADPAELAILANAILGEAPAK